MSMSYTVTKQLYATVFAIVLYQLATAEQNDKQCICTHEYILVHDHVGYLMLHTELIVCWDIQHHHSYQSLCSSRICAQNAAKSFKSHAAVVFATVSDGGDEACVCVCICIFTVRYLDINCTTSEFSI
jgi:hypothetical protein